MEKTNVTKRLTRSLSLLLVFSMLAGMVAIPSVEATEFNASHIQQLNDLAVDYSSYLDNSKMFQLPEGVSDSENISVIITVDGASVMDAYEGTDKTMSFSEYAQTGDNMASVKDAVSKKKAEVLKKLDEKNISYTAGEEYAAILAGFEIIIKAGDFAATCKSLDSGMNAMVGEVYNTCETELVENEVNVFDTGIFNSEGCGYDGSGMVVAVLDTGLDTNHTAFSTDNFTSEKLGLTYNDVKKVVGDTAAAELLSGLTVDDVYVNEKVPYGFDYADKDPDVYSTHNNHGTHVAGVIVGNDDTIRGVAPNAQVVPMKIFSDVEDSAKSAWILAALEDCVVLGVDVINMSIGTACGFSRESDEEQLNGVFDRIRAAGISMIVAASNSFSSANGSEKNGNLGLTSNPDTGTVGSPSTYEGTMSVASIAGAETPYLLYNDTIIYFTESSDASGEENDFFKTLLGDKDSIDIEYVLIPGVGRSADYTGLDVEGKIALVRRGSNTFEEKALIAEEQGAAGIIIYNNVSGDIKMNVGNAQLAVCSISQDDGEMLAKKDSGTLKIKKSQTSGPFISDFSSWGPTPDLRIKPEITAHGGSILSSVTGGGYDRISGTSMACPNLAGVVILLRQYVVENFPELADDNNKVNDMVNRLVMSTADIALNTNGLPYAVRKQGAGLANLQASIDTTAFIKTYDKDGNEMNKTKLELGDDPEKKGVYEMTFSIVNFGEKKLSYKLGGYVLTEGVSETKTNAGETTVTEEAYELDGAKIEIVSVEGGKKSGKTISVKAGEEAKVTVKVTLSDEDKKYLDDSFENGMYVEGFLTLEAKSGTKIDLNTPFLAYYGDWTVAPLFDLTYYDTNADELDDGIDPEDKTMADAYATRPIGGVSDDYVSYLGSYYFIQDPEDIVIAANENYIALSNQIGSVHSLRFVWAGLLRNAERIEVTITDDSSGKVIFETVDDDVRKSYSDGGPTIYPANIEVEFDTTEYQLENNTTYTVRIEGYLDYGEDGGKETNEKNVYEFPLTIDFQAPTVTNVEYRFEYDKTLKKNRLYADAYIYDNHYTMCSQLGYVAMGTDENGNAAAEMKAFEQYMTPVYSEHNSTTKVTYELTDYIYDIKNNAATKNTFVITAYDYALNYATYEIGLPDNFTDFYFESIDEDITLSPNEIYSLEPIVSPSTEWAELLEYSSSKPSVARVVNNKLIAVSKGTATIKAQDPSTNKSVSFKVTVLGKDDEGYRKYDKPVADVFTLDGFQTIKAYYMLDNDDKILGDVGSINFFEGKYSLEMYPSESIVLNYSLDAYFPKDTTVAFESSNESIVKIDQTGTVTAQAEGFASVTIKVLLDGKSTYYSETLSIEVKDPYVQSGAQLTHYYGLGGLVDVPADLSLREIGSFAFSNFEYVMKTEEELEEDDKETSKQWFIGDNTITKVVLPEGIEKINSYAFANLTALEEIVLPSTLESIEYGAFYGCSSLEKITFSGENNIMIVSQSAFEGCDLQGTLELPSICVIGDYAFAGNQNLEKVSLGKKVLSIGQYAFAGCKDVEEIKIEAKKVKYGAYCFTGCKSLKEFTVNSAVLPEGMFYECDSMTKVTVGADVNDIGVFAFRDTKIDSFEISEKNTTYKVQTADHILSADGKTLIAVSPLVKGEFTESTVPAGDKISEIGKGALSHNQKITSVKLDKVTVVGDYGLASNKNLSSVTLGTLESLGEYAFFEASITEMPAFTADTKIGKYAFSFTKLTSVTIPDGMEIKEGTFAECVDLATVVIGNDCNIGDYAFSLNRDLAFKIESFEYNGKDLYRYTFSSPLTSLTIGTNAVIGESAFANAASLETITLGEGAELGKMAFYNMSSLKNVDLSGVKKFGDYAVSGDVYYACKDDGMAYAFVTSDGYYLYTYHGPKLTSIDASAAAEIGEYTFSYCRLLTDVKLSEKLEEIPNYAFAGCAALKNINLEKVEKIGDYAFMEGGLEKVDISGAKEIGEYAFVSNRLLTTVKFSEKKSSIGEGTFSYCDVLANCENLASVENIGDYAFAYVALTEADLTGASSIGKNAFMKEELTEFKVTLGEDLDILGDNPFALCKVAPFFSTDTQKVNGVKQEVTVYDFELSKTVQVIDGSLYWFNGIGLELITFAGVETEEVTVADDTVRISALAFAGSDIVRVKMPYTTTAIGHKAFFDCNSLEIVTFNSYTVPVFEEEYDPAYYGSFENIPGSGDYGAYEDYEGNEVQINGMGLVPYFMWNVTAGGQMETNVLYGANFIDYVGYVESKPIMVRPVNGESYDSFICDQYFSLTLDGPAAPDSTAVAAINAIKALPQRITVEDKELVKAARAAYDKIATIQQQALVTNYADLVAAEQRIATLETKKDEVVDDTTKKLSALGLIIIIVCAVLGATLITVAVFFITKYKEKIAALMKNVAAKSKAKKAAPKAEAETTEEAPAEETESTEEAAEDETAEEENGGEDEAE